MSQQSVNSKFLCMLLASSLASIWSDVPVNAETATPNAFQLADGKPVEASAPNSAPSRLQSILDKIRDGDIALNANEFSRARETYLAGVSDVIELLDKTPTDASARNVLSTINTKLSDLRTSASSQPGFLAAYRAELDFERNLVARYPISLDASLLLALNLEDYGHRTSLTDQSVALAAFEESLALRRKMVPKEGANDEIYKFLLGNIAVMLTNIGETKVKTSDQSGKQELREAADIRTTIAKRFPEDTEERLKAWGCITRLAWVADLSGDRPGAVAAFREGVDLSRMSFGSQDSNPKARHIRLIAVNSLANAELRSGNVEGAKTHYQESVALARLARQSVPPDAQLDRDAYAAASGLVDADLGLKDAAGALPVARELVTMGRNGVAASASADTRAQLAGALEKLGGVDLNLKDLQDASAAFRECGDQARIAFGTNHDSGPELILAECQYLLGLMTPNGASDLLDAAALVVDLEKHQTLPANKVALKSMIWLALKNKVRANVTFDGGDGSSVEHAVRVEGASSDGEGTLAIMSYLQERYPTCGMRSQALLQRQGRNYDSIVCTTPDGNRRELFFDITDSFGKK